MIRGAVKFLSAEERTALEDLVTAEGAEGAAQLLRCVSASYLTSAIARTNAPVPWGMWNALQAYVGAPSTNYLLSGADILIDGSGNRLTNG